VASSSVECVVHSVPLVLVRSVDCELAPTGGLQQPRSAWSNINTVSFMMAILELMGTGSGEAHSLPPRCAHAWLMRGSLRSRRRATTEPSNSRRSTRSQQLSGPHGAGWTSVSRSLTMVATTGSLNDAFSGANMVRPLGVVEGGAIDRGPGLPVC
jgi:hypothetical protein